MCTVSLCVSVFQSRVNSMTPRHRDTEEDVNVIISRRFQLLVLQTCSAEIVPVHCNLQVRREAYKVYRARYAIIIETGCIDTLC